MEIYVQNFRSTVTVKQLTACFAQPLRECGIVDYHCQIPRDKTFAFVTVLDRSSGQRFLSFYSVPEDAPKERQSRKPIYCNGRRLRCQPGHKTPKEFDIRALQHEASIRVAKEVITAPQNSKQTRRFKVSGIRCGMCNFDESKRLAFESHFTLDKDGTVTFGSGQAIVLLGNFGDDQIRMDVNYFACDSITLADYPVPTATFTLEQNPKFYEVKGERRSRSWPSCFDTRCRGGSRNSHWQSSRIGP